MYPYEASKIGKRRSRKNRLEKKTNDDKKYAKTYSKVAVFLLIVAVLIFGFFYWALKKGIAEDTTPNEFAEVYRSQQDLDGERIFADHAKEASKKKALGKPYLTNEGEEISQRLMDTGRLENEIKIYLRELEVDPAKFAFAYYNLENDLYVGINEDEEFFAASVSKLPVAMYLFDLAHEEDLDLSTRLMLRESNISGGDGILKDARPGTTYSLYELAKLMIEKSDNTATNMLYEYLGREKSEYVLDALANRYGISTYDGNLMTADDGILVINRIFKNEDKNPYYIDLLNFMANTDSNDYFTRGIKAEEICHKTGNYKGFINDVGLVYNESGRYGFALFMDNIENAEQISGQIGKIVDDWVQGKIK